MTAGNGKSKKNENKRTVRVSFNPDSTPVLYTDNINMNINDSGVVLNIMQQMGPDQARIVTRIGMSREHAKKFVGKLSELLLLSEGKLQTGKEKLN